MHIQIDSLKGVKVNFACYENLARMRYVGMLKNIDCHVLKTGAVACAATELSCCHVYLVFAVEKITKSADLNVYISIGLPT